MEGVVGGLEGIVPADDAARRIQPCPVAEVPVRDCRYERMLFKERAVHRLEGLCLLLLVFGRCGIVLIVHVLQVVYFRGHERPCDNRVLRKVDGKAEVLIAVQYFLHLLLRPHPLMLVGLEPDGLDGNPGVQAAVDEDFIVRGKVEVVDEENAVRVAFLRRIEHLLYQGDPSVLLADAGNGVIVLVVDGHDDYFIDDVPHVDDALEARNLAVNPLKLLFQNRLVVIGHEPGNAAGMPAERVPLHGHVPALQELRGGHELVRVGLAFLRLKTAPVEGERPVVKEFQPFLHAVFEPDAECLFFRIRAGLGLVQAAVPVVDFRPVCIGKGFECPAAEQELMIALLNVYFCAAERLPVLSHDLYLCFRLSMRQIRHTILLAHTRALYALYYAL